MGRSDIGPHTESLREGRSPRNPASRQVTGSASRSRPLSPGRVTISNWRRSAERGLLSRQGIPRLLCSRTRGASSHDEGGAGARVCSEAASSATGSLASTLGRVVHPTRESRPSLPNLGPGLGVRGVPLGLMRHVTRYMCEDCGDPLGSAQRMAEPPGQGRSLVHMQRDRHARFVRAGRSNECEHQHGLYEMSFCHRCSPCRRGGPSIRRPG
jgi:hypothetical protein